MFSIHHVFIVINESFKYIIGYHDPSMYIYILFIVLLQRVTDSYIGNLRGATFNIIAIIIMYMFLLYF